MPLGPLEDGVQPAVAADPGQGTLDDPPNPLRNEGSAMTAGTGLDGDAKRLTGYYYCVIKLCLYREHG